MASLITVAPTMGQAIVIILCRCIVTLRITMRPLSITTTRHHIRSLAVGIMQRRAGVVECSQATVA
jgi:hypothetical protein